MMGLLINGKILGSRKVNGVAEVITRPFRPLRTLKRSAAPLRPCEDNDSQGLCRVRGS